MPLNIYRTSDYPKYTVSFSPNTVEGQPATSATTVTPFISHKAIEDGQVAEVEEEEENDTDSDTDSDTMISCFFGPLLHKVDEWLELSTLYQE